MTRDHNPLVIERERMEHERNQADIEFYRKFKMFFTGLAFAILSFIGSHPVSTSLKYIKIIEIVALAFILISGLLLLFNLSGVKIKTPLSDFSKLKIFDKFKYVPLYFLFNLNIHYWVCFIIGITLLLVGRAIALLTSSV
ncbi:Uncharacterised protein [Legionella lansingensis]|uniref:Integral membrane protein n=1 Tax=Legionella lansingensis TaxID=45067 RepID=A0A0W0VF02_9GAMM|nr:hypothetical protein [Legionella lansingensis]KTD18724.1 hypothetical protein Llan_2327 [Legionella lansingensis]SNV58044.1 Uncharacterised protein [Legionella lansingensis]